MRDRLEVAVLFIRALALLNVVEIHPDTINVDSLGLFLPDRQIVTAKDMGRFFRALPDRSITVVTDRLQAQFCFIGIADTLLAVGPYRTANLQKQAARDNLLHCDASAALLEPYLQYYQSLPYHSAEDLKIICHTIMLGVYGSADDIAERCIDMHKAPFFGGPSEFEMTDIHISSANIVEQVRTVENYYMAQIAQGNFDTAITAYRDLFLRVADTSASNNLTRHIEGFAIIRTLTRIGARHGGAPSAAVNALTESYRERAYHLRSAESIRTLAMQFINDICTIVRKNKLINYSQPIRQVIDYIHRNIHLPITLEELAAEINLTPGWLSTKFHHETGSTIMEYITSERLQSAADLITLTNMSIQEVSAKVGIYDSNYFTKLFKKKYGVTPKECRRNREHAVYL